MKVKDLAKRLTKLSVKHGDAELMFDTEAMCFDVHLVHIKKGYLIPKKLMGGDREVFCLHWDWDTEPFHFNKS